MTLEARRFATRQVLLVADAFEVVRRLGLGLARALTFDF
jgi:hypothetical protein